MGARAEVIAPRGGTIEVCDGEAKTGMTSVDRHLGEAKASEYAALLLPGGARSSETLRVDDRAVQFVREMMLTDKPVAAIGDGARLLVAADAVAGRTLTSSPSLRADIEAARGKWVDEAVHVDGRLITSRRSQDLPMLSARLTRELAGWLDESRIDETSEASFPASDPPPGPSAVGGTGASSSPAEAR